MRHLLLCSVVAVLVTLLSGCPTVPLQQLQMYNDAFDQARISSNLIYAEMEPALVAGGAAETSPGAEFTASLGPGVYSRSDCPSQVQMYESLLARCEAYNVVAGYNSALSSLAQGASTAIALGRVDRAFASAKTLAALVPVPQVTATFAIAATIFPQVKAILGEALKLRDRAELKAKLEAGAPLIQQMIDALQDDVIKVHQVQRQFYQGRLEAMQNTIDEHVNVSKRIASEHSAATDPTVIALRRSLEARFDALFDRTEPTFGAKRLSDVGGSPESPAFDAQAATRIDKALDEVEVEIGRFHGVVAKWNDFMAALRAYDQLLTTLESAFETLLTLSSEPLSAGGGVEQLMDSTLTVRGYVLEIEKHLSAK